MFLFGDSNFLQALGWAVLNSLWQMAFLWVIFQVVLSFGTNRPAYKTKLASIFLIGGFAWFLYTFISHWIIDPSAAKRSLFAISSFGSAEMEDWNENLSVILPWASIGYLLLLTLPVFQFLRNYRFVQIIRNNGLSKCHVDFRMFVNRFAARMGIHKPVHIYLSDLVTSPVTIGYLKPIILLPLAAISQLSTKQVEAILLHELSHIRRYDYLVNLVINFINTVLYFNPFVKLFVRTVEREREKSCDEIVIQFQYDPLGYASALLELEKNNYSRQTMAIAASGKRYDLLHRVERILGIEKRKTPDFKKLGGLLAGVICVIGLNALFIFGKPLVKKGSFSFSQLGNPFYLFDSESSPSNKPATVAVKPVKAENVEVTAAKSPANKLPVSQGFTEVNVLPDEHFVFTTPEPVNGLVQVDNRVALIPELKSYQVAQVKEAVEATKKILENGKWNELEKNAADALTQAEKEMLREKYFSEVKKLDWKKLENNLKNSYNHLNWDNINLQLSTEITNIKLDSIATVYSIALNNLAQAESWMKENNCISIPDTDLQLKEVKAQREKLAEQLKTVKAIRQRKIIHL